MPVKKRSVLFFLLGFSLFGLAACGGAPTPAAVPTETAVSQFTENKSGHVFLALAYYSNDQKEDAMRTLMEVLLETTTNEDILAYTDVLEFYKDHLEEVWDEE